MARAGLYQLGAGGFRSTGIGNKRSVGKSLGGSSYDETRGGQGTLLGFLVVGDYVRPSWC
jgi:hypothetical protein